jgi:acyl-CoA reductase-like NAD-dependent aldehyde dehydrogenase
MADSDEHRDSVNPATGEVIGSYAMGRPGEAQAAIEAAKRAFADPAWRTNRLLRARVLKRMADRFEERADDLVEPLGLENGALPIVVRRGLAGDRPSAASTTTVPVSWPRRDGGARGPHPRRARRPAARPRAGTWRRRPASRHRPPTTAGVRRR